MKKLFMYIICLCLILNMSMTVNAQEASHKVGEGYTADGVYYEVFSTDNFENDSISMYNTSNKGGKFSWRDNTTEGAVYE
jgi:hypothetical protein